MVSEFRISILHSYCGVGQEKLTNCILEDFNGKCNDTLLHTEIRCSLAYCIKMHYMSCPSRHGCHSYSSNIFLVFWNKIFRLCNASVIISELLCHIPAVIIIPNATPILLLLVEIGLKYNEVQFLAILCRGSNVHGVRNFCILSHYVSPQKHVVNAAFLQCGCRLLDLLSDCCWFESLWSARQRWRLIGKDSREAGNQQRRKQFAEHLASDKVSDLTAFFSPTLTHIAYVKRIISTGMTVVQW